MKVHKFCSLFPHCAAFACLHLAGAGITQDSITKLQRRGIEIGAMSAYFQHALPENPRRARTQWNLGLNKTVDRIMLGSNADVEEWTGPQEATEGDFTANTGLAGEIYAGLLSELTEMADTAKTEAGESGQLAKLYFRYVLAKIADRINEESMEQELIGMIERERRPVCDFLELQNELAKEQMYPVPFSPRLFRSGSRDNNSEVMRVELFNQEWTNAYLRLVSKRVSDDVFRILAVRMVEPLAFECIQYSLNLFSAKGSIGRESEQEMKKVEELEEIKELLMRTHEAAVPSHAP